jgi:hypothetical protein
MWCDFLVTQLLKIALGLKLARYWTPRRWTLEALFLSYSGKFFCLVCKYYREFGPKMILTPERKFRAKGINSIKE